MQFRKDVFLESLSRCRRSRTFAHDFYARLIAKDETIAERFRFTKFDSQVVKFDEALDVCVAATEGKSEALARLAELGESHDIDHHNILPEWYPLWIDALVETAACNDAQWSDQIEASWRALLEHVTNRLASFYLPKGHPDR